MRNGHATDNSAKLTLVTKIQRKHYTTSTGTRRVEDRGNQRYSALRVAVADETNDTEKHESQAKEQPRDRNTEQSLKVAHHQPPHDRCDHVDGTNDVQLIGGLGCLACEKRDLVGVDRKNLAKRHHEGVNGPISYTDGQNPGRRIFVSE